MEKLYLEDFSVGQTFRTGETTIDAAAIKAFAALYDPQPFHLDEDAARSSIFGGLAASGWHTAALTMRLLVDSAFQPAGGLIGLGGDEIRWPQATRPGDVLHCEIEVLEVRPSRSRPAQGLIKVRMTTRNAAGQTLQIFVPNILVPRRPG